MPLSLTGLSSPTASACCASVASEDAMGSSVKVISLNDAARMDDFRPLPVRLASSALAAVSAAAGSLAMQSFAWIWPLSSPLTTLACAFRNGWVTTRLVVTNLPPGHRLASSPRGFPPSASNSASDVAGSQAPSIWPDLNASTAGEFGVVGLMGTSPPPVSVVVRPCCLSQEGGATLGG